MNDKKRSKNSIGFFPFSIYIYIKSKRDQAIAAFKRYDRNNNGKMDVSELKEALKTVFNLDVISDDKILVIIILKLFMSLIK